MRLGVKSETNFDDCIRVSRFDVRVRPSWMAKFVIAVSSTTFEWTRKALTPGYTIQFTAGDTYLQFLIQVCFSSTLPELVFLVSVFYL